MSIDFNQLWNILDDHLESSIPHYLHHNIFLLILMFSIGIAVAIIPNIWKYSGFLVTIYHEGGHALAALSVFSKLGGIRIRRDHSGDTSFYTSSFILCRIWAALWGYPFPALVGSLYIWSALSGWSGIAITITMLFMLVMSLHIRSFIALISIWLSSALLGLIWWYIPNIYLVPFLLILGSFLIVGSFKNVIELLRITYSSDTQNTDATDLRKMTFLPATIWLAVFIMSNILCVCWAIYSTWSFITHN